MVGDDEAIDGVGDDQEIEVMYDEDKDSSLDSISPRSRSPDSLDGICGENVDADPTPGAL